jgi:hypothetical protein
MNKLWVLLVIPLIAFAWRAPDLHRVRDLYRRAPEVKKFALQLDQLLSPVDSAASAPVLVCYKGASEMIKAKYALNPFSKLEQFNRGKALINKAFSRDTLNLEIRFIRFSIQSNLPAFLGYHEEMDRDKTFLLENTRSSKDPELQEMITNYLSSLRLISPEELKELKN